MKKEIGGAGLFIIQAALGWGRGGAWRIKRSKFVSDRCIRAPPKPANSSSSFAFKPPYPRSENKVLGSPHRYDTVGTLS